MREIVVIGLVALFAGPCSKAGDASDGGSATKAAAPAAAPNPMLVEHVKAHAEGCTVNVEAGQAYSCKAGLRDAMEKALRAAKPADFVTSLVTLIQKKDDPKVSATAIAILSEEFDVLGEDGKRRNATPEAIDALIGAYKDNTGNRATRIGKPLAVLATMGKVTDKLFATAESHPTKEARDEVYRNSLTFGRLEAFAKLKDVAAKKKESVQASVDAITKMYKPTDAEKAAVCPWAQGFLGDPDLKIATEASSAMVYCRGTYIDALITEAEKRVKDKQYKNPFAMSMREPCFQFAGALTPSAADAAQCDRVYAFLEKVANDPTVDDATRGSALWNIYYQRRDAKSLKVMRKYENNPNKEISKNAKDAIKSLTETYKLKG